MQKGSCHLFNCGGVEDAFLCKFDTHDAFLTGALEVDRATFDSTSRGHQDRHEDQLKGLYTQADEDALEDEPSKGRDE